MIAALQDRDLGDVADIFAHGYTDDLGTQKYNNLLGFKRANAVIKEMRKANIKMPISAMADGECCFVANNSDEQSRAPNRRVEVVLVKRK